MRSDYVDATARFGNAIQLSDKGHDVRHMFRDVTADDLIKFVIRKRVRNDAEIMNHVSMAFGVRVDPDRSGRFVPAATNVENLLGWAGVAHGIERLWRSLRCFASMGAGKFGAEEIGQPRQIKSMERHCELLL